MAIQGARVAKCFPPHRLSADPTSATVEPKLPTLDVIQHHLHPCQPLSIHPSPQTFFTNTDTMITPLSQPPASIITQQFLSSLEGWKPLLSSSSSSGSSFLSKAVSKKKDFSLSALRPNHNFLKDRSASGVSYSLRIRSPPDSKDGIPRYAKQS